MPGKGEPGWVLRESGRHLRPGDRSGSQTMLCIGVGFTIGHGLIHTLRMGAVCLTQPCPWTCLSPLADRTRPGGKLKRVRFLWLAGIPQHPSCELLLQAHPQRPVYTLPTRFPSTDKNIPRDRSE